MEFRFPIYHAKCDTCQSRFECMTMRIHKTFQPTQYDRISSLFEHIPFRFGLRCFSLEPYAKVTSLKLEIDIHKGEEHGMLLTARWEV